MSFCGLSPRLGTLPRELEKDSVSVVRLSSRTFVVVGVLLGRKIVLKPVPAKFPVKFVSTPSGGCGVAVGGFGFEWYLPSTSWILKSCGRVMAAGEVVA